MSTIGNPRPDPDQQAVNVAGEIVSRYGYGEVRVTFDGRQWIAVTTKQVGPSQFMAQAIGRSPRVAAESLVRVITRP